MNTFCLDLSSGDRITNEAVHVLNARAKRDGCFKPPSPLPGSCADWGHGGGRVNKKLRYIAERLNTVLTSKNRRTLLELKYLIPDDEHIIETEYHQAMIADGIHNYSDFMTWRKNHPVNGIITWCP